MMAMPQLFPVYPRKLPAIKSIQDDLKWSGVSIDEERIAFFYSLMHLGKQELVEKAKVILK